MRIPIPSFRHGEPYPRCGATRRAHSRADDARGDAGRERLAGAALLLKARDVEGCATRFVRYTNG